MATVKEREMETAVRGLTIEAEEDLLGSLMLAVAVLGDEFALNDVKAMVAPSDFLDFSFQGDRARIYGAIIACEHPDIVTVAHELQKQGKLQVNDISFLRQLLLQVPTSYNYMEYAKIVKDLSEKREPARAGGVSLKVRK